MGNRTTRITTWERWFQTIALVALLAFSLATPACQFNPVGAAEAEQSAQPAQGPENAIVIDTKSELPDTYPRGRYEFHLIARGGVSPLHWRLEKGSLPPGIHLEDHGLLFGVAERVGEFQFTLSLTDSGKPQQAVEKQFVIHVRQALTLNWKSPAHVNGNRIDGTVVVSNNTPDDIDLTFIVMAVAPNGRATAIGYQHFELKNATTDKELPFGDTLPRGDYVVHVDAVGEVASRNLIYRERLQTSVPLQVQVGP